MKLSDVKSIYKNSSAKVSNYTRNINYSLIALVWILSGNDMSRITNYREILVLVLFSLVFDFLQYLIKTILVWITYKQLDRELNGDEDKEVRCPSYIQWIIWSCWFIKIITMISAVFTILHNIFQ